MSNTPIATSGRSGAWLTHDDIAAVVLPPNRMMDGAACDTLLETLTAWRHFRRHARCSRPDASDHRRP